MPPHGIAQLTVGAVMWPTMLLPHVQGLLS